MKKNLFILAACLFSTFCHAQTIPAYVSANNLLGWYPFNGNALNENGNGKNGSVIGPVTATDRFGTPGSCYHFNGISDHIVVDTTFFNVGWPNYSVSMWFNSDTLVNPYSGGHNQPLINTGPHNGFDIGYNWNLSGKYSLWINSDPSMSMSWDILSNAKTNAAVTAHTWNHMVIVKDSGTVYRIYINGALDTVFRPGVPVSDYYCKMFFGSIDTNIAPAEGFLGKLDDYGLWDRSLQLCEVRRLYHANPFSYLTTQPTDTLVSPGTPATFTVADTGTGNTYQWQEDAGSGYVDLASTAPYAGVFSPTLTISTATTAMNGNKYRCVVHGAHPCVDTSGRGLLLVTTTALSSYDVNSIHLSPNPTNGYLAVSGAGKVTIQLYNAIGQLVAIAENTTGILIADLPAGIYLARLYTCTGQLLRCEKVAKW